MPQSGPLPCVPTRLLGALALAAALATPLAAPLPAHAQTPPAAPPASTPAPDPVIARVNTTEIRLSDVADAAQSLPAEMRAMPPTMLFPLLRDQLIDRAAIVDLARRRGMDKEPAVARQMARAQDQALQTALISRDVGPLVGEPELRARYARDIAGKPGEEEVHARHILLATEAEAKTVTAELRKGADFATIAKARSTDKASGDGDLGFFKKGDMVPEFAAAAFALKPGQVSETPVKSQFGWHVIRVEARRSAPPPTFEESYEGLRAKIIQEGVEKLLAEARTGLTVEKFNMDGSARKATDSAEPPPAPPKR
ncbi:MAG: peptidylprolyl isomerase [Acetobacteraceae bacterium]|nr:peptidylprolyl isomerase [Acetobacteraceae bacterium]